MNTVRYGLIAGILMSFFLFILNIGGDLGNTFLRFFKYIIFISVMVYLYNGLKHKKTGRAYLWQHIWQGFIMSLTAAFIVVTFNNIFFLIDESYSLSKYNLYPSSDLSFFIINSSIFLEIIVLGTISSFILFPLFKPKDDYRNIQLEKRLSEGVDNV